MSLHGGVGSPASPPFQSPRRVTFAEQPSSSSSAAQDRAGSSSSSSSSSGSSSKGSMSPAARSSASSPLPASHLLSGGGVSPAGSMRGGFGVTGFSQADGQPGVPGSAGAATRVPSTKRAASAGSVSRVQDALLDAMTKPVTIEDRCTQVNKQLEHLRTSDDFQAFAQMLPLLLRAVFQDWIHGISKKEDRQALESLLCVRGKLFELMRRLQADDFVRIDLARALLPRGLQMADTSSTQQSRSATVKSDSAATTVDYYTFPWDVNVTGSGAASTAGGNAPGAPLSALPLGQRGSRAMNIQLGAAATGRLGSDASASGDKSPLASSNTTLFCTTQRVSLGVLEYYMCCFASCVLENRSAKREYFGNQKSGSSRQESRGAFQSLVCDYLEYFLPIKNSAAAAATAADERESTDDQSNSNSSSSSLKSGFLSSFGFGAESDPNNSTDAPSLRHHPTLALSEMFVRVVLIHWLRDQRYDRLSLGMSSFTDDLAASCSDLHAAPGSPLVGIRKPYASNSAELQHAAPAWFQTQCLYLVTKHILAFRFASNCGASYWSTESSGTCVFLPRRSNLPSHAAQHAELAPLTMQLLAAPLFHFVRFILLVTRSPVDSLFFTAVKLWLAFIQPWGSAAAVEEKESGNALLFDLTQSPQAAIWHRFVEDHYLFYTDLSFIFLQRATHFKPLSQTNELRYLYIYARAFATTGLSKWILDAEQTLVPLLDSVSRTATRGLVVAASSFSSSSSSSGLAFSSSSLSSPGATRRGLTSWRLPPRFRKAGVDEDVTQDDSALRSPDVTNLSFASRQNSPVRGNHRSSVMGGARFGAFVLQQQEQHQLELGRQLRDRIESLVFASATSPPQFTYFPMLIDAHHTADVFTALGIVLEQSWTTHRKLAAIAHPSKSKRLLGVDPSAVEAVPVVGALSRTMRGLYARMFSPVFSKGKSGTEERSLDMADATLVFLEQFFDLTEVHSEMPEDDADTPVITRVKPLSSYDDIRQPIREFEIAVLVRWLVRLSEWIDAKVPQEWTFLRSPTATGPVINLRPLGSITFYVRLAIILLVAGTVFFMVSGAVHLATAPAPAQSAEDTMVQRYRDVFKTLQPMTRNIARLNLPELQNLLGDVSSKIRDSGLADAAKPTAQAVQQDYLVVGV
ncbi:hypothetical protein CAOG_01814 [Capsaspora owczarzaki ATCC 30864]|uniref:Sphingomyelin phosphodiesterase 4 n=1 Tax=Capsaspora owczarzaki (strain ATCC 30864) TaxID=595528 RepID=A0A0D2X1B2_CAPO3|nr:hypothetical protein CAOG_01814 [Capsaspora owczarzaki ATCC 30864]KJE90504.1 hypothetical protein CAOG_001814 [Capsaspora owczarzaki ATCC 30864]|eukprot:XP_004364682.1 hypothetical protein CAOG_01814 [Capsaspora owczarzaki ATCC 30864]